MSKIMSMKQCEMFVHAHCTRILETVWRDFLLKESIDFVLKSIYNLLTLFINCSFILNLL